LEKPVLGAAYASSCGTGTYQFVFEIVASQTVDCAKAGTLKAGTPLPVNVAQAARRRTPDRNIG
jgi:hypothetical protein